MNHCKAKQDTALRKVTIDFTPMKTAHKFYITTVDGNPNPIIANPNPVVTVAAAHLFQIMHSKKATGRLDVFNGLVNLSQDILLANLL